LLNIKKAQQCHIQWLNPSFWFNFEYDFQHFESIEFMLKVWLNFYLLLKKILESYNKFAWISISFKINGHVTTSCLDLRFKYAFLLDFFFDYALMNILKKFEIHHLILLFHCSTFLAIWILLRNKFKIIFDACIKNQKL
jgi:hypothetical protein